jgi:Domain of unknown function (DUF3576)
MTPRARGIWTLAAAAAAAAALSGFASGPLGDRTDGRAPEPRAIRDEGPGLLGSLGLGGGGNSKKAPEAAIGVNSFLWRATLDTIAFMPLASADPYGGVITTDWYANPDKPSERFKATVYILDTRLRADGIKVALFRETMTVNGWTTAETNPDTALQIENAILTRARQLRLSTLGG